MRHVMRIRIGLAVFFVLAAAVPGSAQENLVAPAPVMLPGVNRAMKTAGFWIDRHSDPDRVVLNAAGVKAFNQSLADRDLITDITALPDQIDEKALAGEFEKLLGAFISGTYYLAGLNSPEMSFFEQVRENMDISAAGGRGPLVFGFIVRFADQRLLPVDDVLTAKPGDLDFDELQNSSLDAGTPVAVLHASRDRQWFYVRTAESSGWVRQEAVALTTRKNVQRWINARRFAVSVAAKSDIFSDVKMLDHHDSVRMGCRFPLIKKRAAYFMVWVPTRAADGTLEMKRMYVPAGSAHSGYLTYTPRHILEQAFELLNAPYGWGGMYGEQDCSRFIQEIFATVGIRLPRNSSAQAAAQPARLAFDDGTTDEEKITALRGLAGGGMTLLYMKGHIMLSLGLVDGIPYAIHAPWAFRRTTENGEQVYVIGRVVVSDLTLGQGSKRGSLLSRLRKAVEIGPGLRLGLKQGAAR